MTPALSLRHLSKRFGATQVIRDLSLDIAAGERVALVGPNGAGKTTLFHLLSGRHVPTGGQVLLNGRDITGLPPHAIHRQGLARSFQVTQVFAQLSVLDNLRCASLAGLGHGLQLFRRLSTLRDVRQRCDELLVGLGLADRREVLAGELSYPEQRALELGMALAGNPSVLLLDEPTAGMNREETRQAVALIRRLTEGRTLLVVEHDMDVVFGLADRVAVLDQGQLIACDRPEAVRADPRVQRIYLSGTRTDAAGGEGSAC